MINTTVKKRAKRIKQNTGKEKMFNYSPTKKTKQQGPSANKIKTDYYLKLKKKRYNQDSF